jgi:23S rRNA pseudouridine1911/1915/1917 synthase
MNEKINILYQDESIIAIDKQAGMLTIPDRYRKDIPNLKRILTEKFGEIFIVHRLDKDTSGVLVFAKNADSHRNLNLQFQDNLPKRIYHVLVSGIFRKDELEIDIPIIPDPTNPSLSIPSARGKDSKTIVTVLERFKNTTLLQCELVTGRHHQIRVHCGAVGHPLLVDEIYGANDKFFLSSIKRKYHKGRNQEEKPIIQRVSMHSYQLGIIHPTRNEEINFQAEYPKDFKASLTLLRKYSS